MSIYVYAIVRRPVRPGALSSVRGLKLRSVNNAATAAIVVDRADAPRPTIDALRRHDATVRHIAGTVSAVLPVRFGTIFEGDRALRDLLRAWSADLRTALRLVDGREQMTLRLFGGAAARPPRPPRRPRMPAVDVGENAGTRYLQGLAEAQVRERSAPELEPLREALESVVTAERIARHDAGPLVLTAFHLIPRGSAPAYRRLLRTSAAALGLRVTTSGPWPPYAFVPELQG